MRVFMIWNMLLAFQDHINKYLPSKQGLNDNSGVTTVTGYIFFESKSRDFSNNDHQKANIFEVR